jgi:hypothetical protein
MMGDASELAISSSSSRLASIATCDGPFGGDPTIFSEVPPNRVDELGSLGRRRYGAAAPSLHQRRDRWQHPTGLAIDMVGRYALI